MNANDILFCGLVWAQFRKPEAAWELLDAAESQDPEIKSLAEAMLDQSGLCSRELLDEAITGDQDTPVELRLVAYIPGNGVAAQSSDFWWLPAANA